jgi:predicted PurR-regulated permease PerM
VTIPSSDNPSSASTDQNWFSRERTAAFALLFAAGLCIFLSFLIVRPFLAPLTWAVALAVVAQPLYRYVSRWISSPGIAATVTLVVIVIALLLPMIVITDQLVRESQNAIEYINSGRIDESARSFFDRFPSVERSAAWVETRIDIVQQLESAVTTVAENAPSFLADSAWAVAQLLVMVFILFYFLKDRDQILSAIRMHTPLSPQETNRFLERVSETIVATIYGNLIVRAIQGALGGLMFWWLGLPSPVLWGVAMTLLGIVPLLGSFVVWLPACLYLLVEGEVLKSVILLIWGSTLMALADNLVYPLIVGDRLKLHPLLVFFAIIGGILQFGVMGIIVGPVILAVTLALIEVLRKRTAHGHSIDEDLNMAEHGEVYVGS